MAQLIGALGTLVTAGVSLATFLPRRVRRNDLKFDLEALQMLPVDSPARAPLQQDIEARVLLSIKDRGRTRYVRGIAGGLYLIVASPLLALSGFLMPWALPIWVLGTLVGVGSLAEAIPRTERTESGLQRRLVQSLKLRET